MGIDFEELKGKLREPTVLVMAPFKDNLELNIAALKENIRFIMDGGLSNVICPCGNGEYVTLSHEERKMMVEAAVEVGGNKLLVVAGVASNDYKEVIEIALDAAEAGAKCAMIPPPFYYPISQEGIYRWYKIIAEGIKNKIGIMLYSHPWRVHTGGGISVPLLGKLAGIESVVAIKYSEETLDSYITTLSLYSKRFSFVHNSKVYSREIPHMYGEAMLTGIGAFWPEYEAKYWSLLEQHKYEESIKWNAKLAPYVKFLKGEGDGDPGTEGPFPLFNASVIKTGLEYVGLYGGPVRPPFIELTKEQKKRFFGVLEGMGVPKKR